MPKIIASQARCSGTASRGGSGTSEPVAKRRSHVAQEISELLGMSCIARWTSARIRLDGQIEPNRTGHDAQPR